MDLQIKLFRTHLLRPFSQWHILQVEKQSLFPRLLHKQSNCTFDRAWALRLWSWKCSSPTTWRNWSNWRLQMLPCNWAKTQAFCRPAWESTSRAANYLSRLIAHQLPSAQLGRLCFLSTWPTTRLARRNNPCARRRLGSAASTCCRHRRWWILDHNGYCLELN